MHSDRRMGGLWKKEREERARQNEWAKISLERNIISTEQMAKGDGTHDIGKGGCHVRLTALAQYTRRDGTEAVANKERCLVHHVGVHVDGSVAIEDCGYKARHVAAVAVHYVCGARRFREARRFNLHRARF